MAEISSRKGFSIRTKLLLVGLLLLLIPWMSYVYVRDMKTFLLSGQENALSLTARAVSTVLHDRPELFRSELIDQEEKEEEKQNEIYAFPLPNYIRLDGNLQDWGEQERQGVSYHAESNNVKKSASLTVKHLLGYHGRYIYAFFDITDNKVLLRKKDFLRVDTSDHVRLTIQNPNIGIKRYTLSAREPGRMSIYLMDEEWHYPVTGQPNYNLAAEMQLTDDGYLIELRIPRYMMSSDSRIKLSVADVDNEETREIEHIIATTPKSEDDDFSQIIVHTPEIAKILQALNRSDTRIWVLDNEKRVRAVVGNLILNSDIDTTSKAIPPELPKTAKEYLDFAKFYYNRFLQKIFNLIIDKPHTDFSDHDSSTQQRNDAILDKAIGGLNATERRASLDQQGTILMSAHPIWSADKILGAVVVEQSSNQVLNQQRQVLENIISVTLLVLVTVVVSLLSFASRLTLRIRRLRNATDNAIDRDGRILSDKLTAEVRAGDEIGDLSRSISNMLGRLTQYTSYLEGLPDTLAHEVSNPLNVVNSSLHNISEQFVGAGKSKYMERARNGVNRIGSILTNLTEAANLEQAMQTEDREIFDVVSLIESYVEGYKTSHPDQEFELDILAQPLNIEGTPDHIAQMLDKLVDNALDFSAKFTPIIVRTRLIEDFAAIDVINQGSTLPKGMAERIFEPLVSVGRKDAQKLRLGMGLYIVKLITRFHGGDVTARNLKVKKGVVFTVTLPLADADPTKIAPKF